MADFQPVTVNRYSHKYWQNSVGYKFSSTDAVCPIVMQEMPKAVHALPIGFISEGNAFVPVAVQGIAPGKNLFVADDGRWLTGYIPALYRSYPFRMALTEDGEHVLCVDEASGFVSESTGESFFSEDGTPSKAVLEILEFFKQMEGNRELTRNACAVLQKHNLIQQWPITIKNEQGEQNIEGLFRVDEAALNTLSDQALLEVRNAGGLLIAYCQLLSMQHMAAMGELAAAHANAKEKSAKGNDSNLGFMSEGSTFSFGS